MEPIFLAVIEAVGRTLVMTVGSLGVFPGWDQVCRRFGNVQSGSPQQSWCSDRQISVGNTAIPWIVLGGGRAPLHHRPPTRPGLNPLAEAPFDKGSTRLCQKGVSGPCHSWPLQASVRRHCVARVESEPECRNHAPVQYYHAIVTGNTSYFT